MPVAPTFPGVYIEEIPSGVRTIVGVATSIGAFIDFLPRGLLDEAIRILSFADFEREFGGLDSRSEASYAIQQFFLNGGTEALVVRIGGGTIDTADVTLAGGGNNIVNVRAGRRIRGASARNPGVWGNVFVVITGSAAAKDGATAIAVMAAMLGGASRLGRPGDQPSEPLWPASLGWLTSGPSARSSDL